MQIETYDRMVTELRRLICEFVPYTLDVTEEEYATYDNSSNQEEQEQAEDTTEEITTETEIEESEAHTNDQPEELEEQKKEGSD